PHDVLERNGDPVQCAAIVARADLALCDCGILHRLIGGDSDERMQAPIERLDAGEAFTRKADRRKLTGADALRDFGEGAIVQRRGDAGFRHYCSICTFASTMIFANCFDLARTNSRNCSGVLVDGSNPRSLSLALSSA